MTKVSDRKKEEKREKEKNEKDREKRESVTSDDDRRRRQRRGRVNSNERPAAKGKRSDNDDDYRSIEKLILPLLRGNENPFEGERAFFRSESDLKFSSGKREGASTSAST